MSLGFAVLSIVLATRLIPSRIAPLRISAGPADTRRYALAEMLAQHAAKSGLAIALSTDAGSEECLKLLKNNQLDAAVVSNGVVIPHDDELAVVAVTQLEMVHLLIRSQIAEAPSIIDGLHGRRVDLGKPGSTEALLSREILRFARLSLTSPDHPGDIVPTEMGKSELLAKCRQISAATDDAKAKLISELPDAIIVLDAPPSAVTQQLIEVADYRVAALPATRAFLLDNLQDASDRRSVIQREFLEAATIPRHCYFAHRALPENDCETVGARLLIVARNDAPESSIRALMSTLFNSELTHRLSPLSPRDVASPYPVHSAAQAWLDREKPVALDNLLDWLSNGLSVFGAFSAGALSLYSLLRRRRYRPPEDYYESIHKVEQLACTFDSESAGGVSPPEYLRHLDERLVALRQELIEDICQGRIRSEQLVLNILTLLKDARDTVHAREMELSHLEMNIRRPDAARPAESPRAAA